MSNDKQNQPQSGSPVQRLVGQLRELLAKATPGPWEKNRRDIDQVGGDYSSVLCTGEGRGHQSYGQHEIRSEDLDLIIGAINNLPSLLKIVEVADQWNRATTFEDSMGHLSRLRRALRLLPNAQDQRAGPDDPSKAGQAVVAGSGASTCWADGGAK